MTTFASGRVSVVLPVKNGRRWIRETLESVLGQNEAPHEVIIVDDGSIDGSSEILEEYLSERTNVVLGPGRGLAAALDFGIAHASGDYIMRVDQDDPSRIDRLQIQRRFLDAHPDVVMCGSWAQEIDEGGKVIGYLQPPTADESIKTCMCFRNPFVHSTTMIRRSALMDAGGYWSPSPAPFPEDFSLWTRMAGLGRMSNIPSLLVQYRRSPQSILGTNRDSILEQGAQICQRYASTWFELRPDNCMGFFQFRPTRLKPGEACGLIVDLWRIWRRSTASGLTRGLLLSDLGKPVVWLFKKGARQK